MKSAIVVLLLTFSARADVLKLLPSSQSITYTGLGANGSGSGTVRILWGSCTYDGNTSTCIVSGRYTGLGGGAYRFVLTYPGNGVSPLTAFASPAGSNLVTFSLSAGSFEFLITPDSNSIQTEFYNLNFSVFFDDTSQCTGVTMCSVGAVGNTANATITGPVNGQFDATPTIRTGNGVVTATGYGGFSSVAPATWIEIYGQNLSTTLRQQWGGSDFQGAQAPVALGGTTVTIGGQPAFVEYVSPVQVNAQLPSATPLGTQKVVVTTAGGSSIGTAVTVNSVEPGLLATPAFQIAGVQYAVAQFPDGKTYVLPPAAIAGVPSRRAKPGDTITLYGVGFGPVSPNINAGLIVGQSNTLPGFQASVAGQPATVQYAGLVTGFLGLYQFNLVIPQVSASDSAALTFLVGGVAGTQTLNLPITN